MLVVLLAMKLRRVQFSYLLNLDNVFFTVEGGNHQFKQIIKLARLWPGLHWVVGVGVNVGYATSATRIA